MTRWLFVCLLLASFSLRAESTYLAPDEFLQQTFAGKVPAPELFWFDKEQRRAITDILGHAPHGARTRYWREGKRSAWILDEIGKEHPITFGVVINDQQIERIAVLIYRESRGWEVRSDAFTGQFDGARLTGEQKLSKPIDGITGATLSVRAMQNIARMALYMHQQLP
ncbi:FMN-binding protein [Permianibacter aggregans]|uniref:FMN-binding protein n=1 Tax=Permianibacter aggregans TaxID=1510150 RepID=A0A4R6UM28_9GAMM|nr:FMN-binding protein [Permianibacter aggregans]QGX41055.1 FMN-binding protein [Permianibacter aggregans]TDQ48120.1 FMN-binding protein [Permianibacter aggregans]